MKIRGEFNISIIFWTHSPIRIKRNWGGGVNNLRKTFRLEFIISRPYNFKRVEIFIWGWGWGGPLHILQAYLESGVKVSRGSKYTGIMRNEKNQFGFSFSVFFYIDWIWFSILPCTLCRLSVCCNCLLIERFPKSLF